MDLELLCRHAKAAKYEIQGLSTDKKNEVLEEVAKVLLANNEQILMENAIDITTATAKGHCPD